MASLAESKFPNIPSICLIWNVPHSLVLIHSQVHTSRDLVNMQSFFPKGIRSRLEANERSHDSKDLPNYTTLHSCFIIRSSYMPVIIKSIAYPECIAAVSFLNWRMKLFIRSTRDDIKLSMWTCLKQERSAGGNFCFSSVVPPI